MTDLWIPGAAGPDSELVARLHRQIRAFADKRGLAKAIVEVELRGGARFQLDSLSAQPGYGFVTLCPQPGEDVPAELIVPVGAIARIELLAADEPDPRFGFSVPEAD